MKTLVSLLILCPFALMGQVMNDNQVHLSQSNQSEVVTNNKKYKKPERTKLVESESGLNEIIIKPSVIPQTEIVKKKEEEIIEDNSVNSNPNKL